MSPVGTPYDAMGSWTPPEKGERHDATQRALQTQADIHAQRRAAVRERWANEAAAIRRACPQISVSGAVRALDAWLLMHAADKILVQGRVEELTKDITP